MAKHLNVKMSFSLTVPDNADSDLVEKLIAHWIANYVNIDDVDEWKIEE